MQWVRLPVEQGWLLGSSGAQVAGGWTDLDGSRSVSLHPRFGSFMSCLRPQKPRFHGLSFGFLCVMSLACDTQGPSVQVVAVSRAWEVVGSKGCSWAPQQLNLDMHRTLLRLSSLLSHLLFSLSGGR